MTPEGIKTSESDSNVTQKFVELQLDIGIEAMTHIGSEGEQIKHFTY
jgi:AMP nucleosidase